MTLCSSGKYSRSDDLLYLAQAFSGYLLETEINQLQSMLNKAKNGDNNNNNMGTWFQFQMTSLSHYSILRRNFMNLVEVSMVRRCDVNMALWIASHGTKRFELTRLYAAIW